MSNIKTLLILVTTAFSLLVSFNCYSNTIKDQQFELKQAVEALGVAFSKADISTLESLITDNYIHINGRSGNVIDKQTWLNWNKSRQKDIATNKEVIERYQISALQIEIFENTAFVTGIVTSSGTRNAKKFNSKIRFSNVWIRSKNQWKRAAFHDSSIE